MKLAVESRNVIGHVCVLEEFNLSGKNLLCLGILALLLGSLTLELDQRKEKMSAQVRRKAGHDRRAVGRDGVENVLHIG